MPDLNVGGLKATAFFLFNDNNQLFRAAYFFEEEHSFKNKYIYDYRLIKEKLNKKYGAPNLKDDAFWENDLYKDEPSQWGFAVSLGHLRYATTYKKGDTLIRHTLEGDNFKISHKIIYFSTDEKLEPKHKDDSSDL